MNTKWFNMVEMKKDSRVLGEYMRLFGLILTLISIVIVFFSYNIAVLFFGTALLMYGVHNLQEKNKTMSVTYLISGLVFIIGIFLIGI